MAEEAPDWVVSVSRSSEAPMGSSTNVPEIYVRAAPGQRIVLETVVEGAHQWLERHHMLPESFRVEDTPFKVEKDPRERAEDRFYRILYHNHGKDLIAGVLDYWERSSPHNTQLDATLTNVPCGYDPKARKFWVEADPAQMPPVPKHFRVMHRWPGKRFLVPLALEHHGLDLVKSEIEARGGYVVTCPEGPVDVVLLPDDVDFVWTRNKAAELWVRRGAEVLWEKNFPRP
jgi:hypothetical protein